MLKGGLVLIWVLDMNLGPTLVCMYWYAYVCYTLAFHSVISSRGLINILLKERLFRAKFK